MAAEPQLRATLADRYSVERELGRGGTAAVYLARDLRPERAVALKVHASAGRRRALLVPVHPGSRT
jgi:hypothetical protein